MYRRLIPEFCPWDMTLSHRGEMPVWACCSHRPCGQRQPIDKACPMTQTNPEAKWGVRQAGPVVMWISCEMSASFLRQETSQSWLNKSGVPSPIGSPNNNNNNNNNNDNNNDNNNNNNDNNKSKISSNSNNNININNDTLSTLLIKSNYKNNKNF